MNKPTRKYTSFDGATLGELAAQIGLFARDVYTRLDALPAFELVTRVDVYNEPFSIKFGLTSPSHIVTRVRDRAQLDSIVNTVSPCAWEQESGGALIRRVASCVVGTLYTIDFLVIGDW